MFSIEKYEDSLILKIEWKYINNIVPIEKSIEHVKEELGTRILEYTTDGNIYSLRIETAVDLDEALGSYDLSCYAYISEVPVTHCVVSDYKFPKETSFWKRLKNGLKYIFRGNV